MQKETELNHLYSNGITGKRIIILGPCPPPIGGVSIHVRRVGQKLRGQKNKVVFFDPLGAHRGRFWFYKLKLALTLFSFRPHQVHYHTLYASNCLPELYLINFLKKLLRFDLLFVEHISRYLCTRDVSFKKKLGQLLSKNRIVFIGEVTRQSYFEHNIQIPEQFSVESAFLPPDESREEEILSTYPASLFEFIKSSKPLIVANASKLLLLGGKDLYGFDTSVELLSRLKEKYPEAKLLLALARFGDEEYFSILKKHVDFLGLGDSVYFLTGDKELWPLLKKADLFIRPTISDSFGISISEALWFGTPSVASDVCVRSEGTVLFRAGDREDFFKKAFGILAGKHSIDSAFVQNFRQSFFVNEDYKKTYSKNKQHTR